MFSDPGVGGIPRAEQCQDGEEGGLGDINGETLLEYIFKIFKIPRKETPVKCFRGGIVHALNLQTDKAMPALGCPQLCPHWPCSLWPRTRCPWLWPPPSSAPPWSLWHSTPRSLEAGWVLQTHNKNKALIQLARDWFSCSGNWLPLHWGCKTSSSAGSPLCRLWFRG